MKEARIHLLSLINTAKLTRGKVKCLARKHNVNGAVMDVITSNNTDSEFIFQINCTS